MHKYGNIVCILSTARVHSHDVRTVAVGIVEVNNAAEGFLKCLLGLVFHNDTMAKSTKRALEDVPSVEAANVVLDRPLIIAREDFAYSCWSNTAARLLV